MYIYIYINTHVISIYIYVLRFPQGADVVQGIEKVKCDKDDKPIMDIKIISIVCRDD